MENKNLPKIIVCENEYGAITLVRSNSDHYRTLEAAGGNTFYPLTPDLLAVPPVSTSEAAAHMKKLMNDLVPGMGDLEGIFELDAALQAAGTPEEKPISEEEKLLNSLKRNTVPNDYKKNSQYTLVDNVKTESTNVGRIGYTTENDVMVEFSDGSEYLYKNVPEQEYKNLKFSQSVGSHVNRELKGKYKTIKLERE